MTFSLESRSISGCAHRRRARSSRAPTRREPFADSPAIGPRGLRTHQRILDAALEAFGESGYDRTTLDRIAELAGCSRVTIYQYASGKDDLFRRLATQAAAQMWAAFEALDDVTPDASGHASLLACISRLADIEARYEPIIRAFEAAAETDRSLAGGAASITRRARRRSSKPGSSATDLPPRLLDPTVELLNTGVISALSRMSILRAAAPEHYGRERVDAALADVVHRALFGPLPGVNVHPRRTSPTAPVLRLSPEAQDDLRPGPRPRSRRGPSGQAGARIHPRGRQRPDRRSGLPGTSDRRRRPGRRGVARLLLHVLRRHRGLRAGDGRAGDPGRVRGRARPPRGADPSSRCGAGCAATPR